MYFFHELSVLHKYHVILKCKHILHGLKKNDFFRLYFFFARFYILCMYERFRLSISSLRGALTQPIKPRNFEPRSSDEVDTWAGTQGLTLATSYARTVGTLDSPVFTSTSVPVYTVGLYLASIIKPGTLRSRANTLSIGLPRLWVKYQNLNPLPRPRF